MPSGFRSIEIMEVSNVGIDWQPLLLSFKVAAAALLLTFASGTLTARWMSARHFRGQELIEGVLMLPLVLPPVVTGYALLLLFGRQGALGQWLESTWGVRLLFTPWAAVLASSVVAFPLMYQSAKAAFLNIDPHLIDAARSLGADDKRVFCTIAAPLARPGLIAGAVLSFARALGEFGATIMVAGNIAGRTTTAPTAIYMASESGDLQTAGFYAIVLGALNFTFLIALNLWRRKR
ncbi:MAG: molybdate transport system permease protein [Abditibacteriota bacterium]|nr:molybdate transport system permease protein [Abditibacteriota bacterium]